MMKQTLAPFAAPVLLAPLALAEGLGPIDAQLNLENTTLIAPQMDEADGTEEAQLQVEL